MTEGAIAAPRMTEAEKVRLGTASGTPAEQ